MNGSLRILIAVVVVIGGIAAAIFLGLMPMRDDMRMDEQAIAKLRSQLNKLKRVERRISDLKGEIDRLEEALSFFENRLPKEKEFHVILKGITEVAAEADIKASIVKTKKEENRPRYSLQPVNVTLKGTWESFYRFMLGLERLPRITKIRELQLQRTIDQDGAVHVDLLLDIFYEK